MKLPWRAVAFSSILSAAMAGCIFTKEGPEPRDIVPLAVGNTWIYVDSAVYGPDSVVTGSSEANIVGTRTLAVGADSVTVFLLNAKNPLDGQPGPQNTYVRTLGHSNYTYGAEEAGAAFVDITPHVRWPAKAGESNFTHFVGFRTVDGNRLPALDTINILVVNPDTACIVPAGTFRCVHYQGYRLDGTLFADAWYAPGIGSLGNELRRTILVGDSLRTVRFVKKLTAYALH